MVWGLYDYDSFRIKLHSISHWNSVRQRKHTALEYVNNNIYIKHAKRHHKRLEEGSTTFNSAGLT